MLTLSLDEYGNFEKPGTTPVFIGGIIFDDHGEVGEESRERRRIKSYYKAVIADAENGASECDRPLFVFPEALHSNNIKSRDKKVVAPVKQLVRESIAEFIQKGTYQSKRLTYKDRQTGKTSVFPDRKGIYHIFAIMRSDSGMRKLLSDKANFLAKDDYASNLYFHMADMIISRLIFYNPIITGITDIALDIATRTSRNFDHNDYKARQYESLGYRLRRCDEKDPKSQVYFELTNKDIYRTVIAEEILDAEQPNISIDLNVRSIRYSANRAESMAYLYLADSICSVLGFNAAGRSSADERFCSVTEIAASITGRKDNLIFAYDEIDNIYAKAWQKLEEGDYYSALSIIFDTKKRADVYSTFYNSHWFRLIEDRILSSGDVARFGIAVRNLNESIRSNTFEQDKGYYILSILSRMVPVIEECSHTPESKKVIYALYDAGVSACCHVGKSREAAAYYEKCVQYADLASLDDYLNTRNKMVVYSNDTFESKRAEKIADENVTYQELLAELRKEMGFFGTDGMSNQDMGKALSQRAQVYAYQRDNRAERDFRKALSCFIEDSANYKITESYLLHYYLDNGIKDAYMVEAQHYFGDASSLQQQLDYIMDEGSKTDPLINVKYALYVYVRGLWSFRLHELNREVWKNLKNFEISYGKRIGKSNWQLTGDPSGTIFKYMRLIAYRWGDEKTETHYAQRAKQVMPVGDGAIEHAVQQFGEIEVANEKMDMETRDALSARLWKYIRDEFPSCGLQDEAPCGDVMYRHLEKLMCFMRR